MTTPIDIGGDVNPFGDLTTLEGMGETQQQYVESMGEAAPGFFEVVLGGLYAPIATGFESAAFSASDAYAEVNRISAGQVQIAGVIANLPPSSEILDPKVQLHLVLRYLGRQHAWELGAQELMHRVMHRQISVLSYALNQTRAAITGISRNIIRYVQQQTAVEAQRRAAGDGAVIRLAFALRDQVVRDLHTFVTKEVFVPIVTEIGKVDAHRAAVTTQQIQASRITTLAEVAAMIAPVAAVATQANKIATGLQTVNAECVQPMCDTMGPNTNLGQLFNKLKGIKWLAILAALELLDIKDLEALAERVYGFEGEIGGYVARKILDELEQEHGPAQ